MALSVYTSLLFPFVSIFPEPSSINGIIPINTPPGHPDASTRYGFGTIYDINDITDRVAPGQKVMYDKGQAILVAQGGQQVYLMDENWVILIENIPA